jgi:hypothetical protein
MVFGSRRLLRVSGSCVLIHEHVIHELFKRRFVLYVSLSEVGIVQAVMLGDFLILGSL